MVKAKFTVMSVDNINGLRARRDGNGKVASPVGGFIKYELSEVVDVKLEASDSAGDVTGTVVLRFNTAEVPPIKVGKQFLVFLTAVD